MKKLSGIKTISRLYEIEGFNSKVLLLNDNKNQNDNEQYIGVSENITVKELNEIISFSLK